MITTKDKSALFRAAAGFIAFSLLMLAGLASASAQGIFERIFSSLHHPAEATRPPTNIMAFVDPLTSPTNTLNPPRQQNAVSGGPSKAFCVRTCDGRYFPVQARAGLSAAQSCRAFCPASQTRLYTGGSIDYAVAGDGSRYADLANAFVYRKRLVSGCTCNGRNAFGLAHIDANNDPTLRPGDIVATRSGLVAFVGVNNKVADFTPVENYSRFSRSTREKLSETRIMPPTPAAPEAFASIPSSAAANAHIGARSAQLTR